MFKGKASFLKNLGYLLLLGLHSVVFIYFLLYTYLDLIPVILCSISFIILIGLAFYSFLTSKSYFYFFYFGIVISSIPIIFIVYISAILIVPEVVVLVVILFNALDESSNYYKMRVDKEANLLQHDPAVSGMFRNTPGYPAFKMDEVWNPDSAVDINKEEKLDEKVKSNRSPQLLTGITASVFLICAIISVSYYYIITFF
jgi:hypothetical protein